MPFVDAVQHASGVIPDRDGIHVYLWDGQVLPVNIHGMLSSLG